MPQIRFRPGLRPEPRWGSSRRSPRPPSRLGRGIPSHSPPPSTPTASRSRRPEFHFPKVGNPTSNSYFYLVYKLLIPKRNELMPSSVTARRPFVCKHFARIASPTRLSDKMAESRPNLHIMVPKRACIQDVLEDEVKVEVKGHFCDVTKIASSALSRPGRRLEKST